MNFLIKVLILSGTMSHAHMSRIVTDNQTTSSDNQWDARNGLGIRIDENTDFLKAQGCHDFLFSSIFVSQKLPDHTPLRCGQHKLGNR